ncbi:amidase family protein [Actinotignum sanguinis]|uniref:amidase family protein n=1 Tax=Actinotignum sanguinis TaxID=1445614 RepID=UPI002A8158F2|nr:amidase family protein [Actinotignum sanguinis]MDY5137521.1 amidase family protein [Actinotignum sanguinis]
MAFLEDSVDPLDLSAVQLARLMRTGHLDPVAHTERVLERARSRGAAVGAFTHIAEEFSLRQARAATAQLKEGKGGPLTGVPFPIKDLDDVAGLPTEYGSRAMRGNIATTTGGVAQSILDAGTVTIGKTTTPEFGFVGYTEPAGIAPARTPWDLTCSAGGSSGGAAAAVEEESA